MSTRNLTAITEQDAAALTKAVDRRVEARTKFDLAEALTLRIQKKLTNEEIADRLNVSVRAVSAGLEKFLRFINDPGELEAFRNNKGSLLEAMEWKLLSFLQDRMDCGPARDDVKGIASALKVVAELKRLEAGQSTSNISIFIKSIEDAHKGSVDGEVLAACPPSSDKLNSSGSGKPLTSPLPLPQPESNPEPTVISSSLLSTDTKPAL